MALRGYLLDTNIVSYWFTGESPQHELINRRIQSLPGGSLLAVSAITLGEIEYGHRVVSPKETAVQADFLEFIGERLPTVFPVEAATRLYYGRLRALLFEKFVPSRKKRGLRPEQLVDPVTSLDLGIQENDLWIAAQALEYNLVLVTADKLQRIREVAAELEVENWAA